MDDKGKAIKTEDDKGSGQECVKEANKVHVQKGSESTKKVTKINQKREVNSRNKSRKKNIRR